MTLSDATPHKRTHDSLEAAAAEVLGTVNSLEFVIGPEHSPADALEQAKEAVAATLPMLLGELSGSAQACVDTLAVLTELVDITARHRASLDLVGKVSYDGAHITVSVGDIACALPPSEEEPGLYTVRGVADEVGQHVGDNGGLVTWAAIEARR